MKTDDVIVSFRGVRKTYDGETLVVKQLDLDIYQGEFLTLLGPSGSGKTTCLMMLAGFEFPTGGEIWLDGTLLNTVPPRIRVFVVMADAPCPARMGGAGVSSRRGAARRPGRCR